MLTIAELEQRIPGDEGQWETGSLMVEVVKSPASGIYGVKLYMRLDFFDDTHRWLGVFSMYDKDRHSAMVKFVSDLQELDRSHFQKAAERLEQWQTRPKVGRPALERLVADGVD